MRIAVISEHASPLAALGGVDSGGQNVYVASIARHLVRMGHEVDVFTRRDSAKLPPIVEWNDGVRIIHVDAGPSHFVRKEEMLAFMGEFTNSMLWFMESTGRSYDVIHANFWMSGLVAADIKVRRSIPFAVTFHALGKVRRLHHGGADDFPDERFAIEERIVAEADRIIAECPQDEEDLVAHYNAPLEKISIIPCGFDPAEFWPVDKVVARREVGLPDEGLIILQLGRIVPRKGVDNAIRGFASLVREHGQAALLVIVGGESTLPNPAKEPEIARLKAIAREEGVGDRVIFAGRRNRERLRYYYSASDIFVTTPWYEPFGITPLEAMACGVPVVGSNVGGIRYSVSDGETGYLIPPKDPEALARCLAHLCLHHSVLESLSRNATRRVRELFTWQKVALALAGVFEEVVEKSVVRTRVSKESQYCCVARDFDLFMSTLQQARASLQSPIIEAGDAIAACFLRGGTLMVCGNGGSAADAQHFAAELVGRFRQGSRRALAAIALTADTAILTAWSNDAGYEHVFARQVEAIGRAGDILLVISTSGRSANLLRACEKAHEKGLSCIGLLGCNGGDVLRAADISVVVPSFDTQRIQEIHLFILHTVAALVEEQVTARNELQGASAKGLSSPRYLNLARDGAGDIT